eukprot:2732183-Rhodomonas_salina.1
MSQNPHHPQNPWPILSKSYVCLPKFEIKTPKLEELVKISGLCATLSLLESEIGCGTMSQGHDQNYWSNNKWNLSMHTPVPVTRFPYYWY